MKADDIIDNFSKSDLLDLLFRLNEKINYIQEKSIEHRKLLKQVITQNNSLVKFLASLEIEREEVYDNQEYIDYPPLPQEDEVNSKTILELAKSLMDQKQELKDFEEELKKHKDKLTPGQIGEA